MALWTTEDIFAAEAFWRETAGARYHDGLAALRRQHMAAAAAVHNAASVPTSTVRLSPSPDRPQRHYYGRPSQEPAPAHAPAHASAHASPAAKHDDGLSLRRLSSSRGDASRSPSDHCPPFDASTRLSEPSAAASPGAANRAARFHPSQRSVPHEARPAVTRTDAHEAGGHRRLPSPELDTPQRPSAASPPGRRSETLPPCAPEPAARVPAARRPSLQHEAPSAAIAVWRRRLQRTEALEAACRAELRRVAAEDLLLAIGPALPTDPYMAPCGDAQRREGTTQARPLEPAPTRLFEGGGGSTPHHPRPPSTGAPALAPEPPAAGESWRGSGVPFGVHAAVHAAAPAHATFHEDELQEPRSPGAVLPRSASNALSIASSAAAYARNPELARQHAGLPPTLGPSPHNVVGGHDAPGLDDLPSVVSRPRDEGSEVLPRRPSIWADGSCVPEQVPEPSPRPEGATLLSTASAAAAMDAEPSAGPQHDTLDATLDAAGSVFAASTVLSAGPMGSAAAQGGDDDGVFVSRLLGCAVNTRLELQPLRAAPDGCLVAAPSPALAFRPRDVLATAGGTPILTLPALRRWESAVAAAGRGVRPAVVVVLRADGGRGPRKIPVSLRELT